MARLVRLVLLAERVDVRGVGRRRPGGSRGLVRVPLGGPLMRVDTGAVTARVRRTGDGGGGVSSSGVFGTASLIG